MSAYVGETERNIAKAFQQARQQKSVLQLDEVDSFLQDRSKADRNWAVTQVNEMLTQMESFDGVFIASTNLFANLDEASLRRFDLAIKLDFMKPDAAWAMFSRTCEILGLGEPDAYLRTKLWNLRSLTPGDFEQVIRRSKLMAPDSPQSVFSALESAVRLKKSVPGKSIGFLAAA
jgi:SpoVK/Ycf46/Vps4 family AAA+-type ATPase